MSAGLAIPGDWFAGALPACAQIADGALVESTYSFHRCRTQSPGTIQIDRGASVYSSTVFDAGPAAQVRIGEYALLNGVWICCDLEIVIGSFCLLSWQVLLIDSYRASAQLSHRRAQLMEAAVGHRWPARGSPKPIRLGSNVWIGFKACILPGVTIGDGAIVAACAVVSDNVPPYCVVAGNPARVIRQLDAKARADAD